MREWEIVRGTGTPPWTAEGMHDPLDRGSRGTARKARKVGGVDAAAPADGRLGIPRPSWQAARPFRAFPR